MKFCKIKLHMKTMESKWIEGVHTRILGTLLLISYWFDSCLCSLNMQDRTNFSEYLNLVIFSKSLQLLALVDAKNSNL